MVLASNFLYFVSFKSIFANVSDEFKKKHTWLDVRNQSFDQDINKNLELWFRKTYSTKHEDNMYHWREEVIWYSQIIPMCILCFEMMVNKLRLKMSQLTVQVKINLAYFLTTFIVQLLYTKPAYTDNLNWTCSTNLSFLYNRQTLKVNQTLFEETCDRPYDRHIYNCELLSESYYCPVSESEGRNQFSGLQPYSFFKNCMLMVITVMLITTVVYVASCSIHEMKLFNTKAFLQKPKKNALEEEELLENSEVMKNKPEMKHALLKNHPTPG